MENLDLMAMLMEHGPTALAFLIGLFVPADKLPILKNFLGKTSDKIEE
jgi:hypothetical protein